MPPVVAAVVAAFNFIAAGVAVFFGSVGGIGAFLGKLALNFAISALVGKLNRPKSGSGYAAQTREQQVVVRSAIAARNLIYGRAVTSGPLLFAHTSGGSKEYLHLVVALAGHEIDGVEKIYFNDVEVGALDGAGNVTTGRFAGYARIKIYLGTSTQTADADLVSESGGIWTANHRCQGVAYLYVRLRHSYDVYAGGLPNIKAQVRGKKVYDPRDAATRWTDNAALIARDYLLNPLGLLADAAEIDETYAAAAANVCDERVAVTATGAACTFDAAANTLTIAATELRFDNGDGVRLTTSGALPAPLAVATTYYLIRTSATTCQLATTAANARDRIAIDLTTAGSGTHQLVHHDQSRYTANGILVSDRTPRDNVQAILTAMAGAVTWVQGKYRVHAGAYTAPAFSLDEDDLRGSMAVQAKTPRKDLFNAVRGVYVEPWKFWQPTDFPPIVSATYQTQDGAQIFRDIDLPMVANQIRAQRIAKIHLEKSRQGITVQLPCKFRALELAAWATVSLSIAQLGWASKVFRVMTWQMTPDGGVDLALQEESAASYGWSDTDATVVDAAPDTTLPSLITVAAPTSLVLDSGSDQAFVNADGTVTVQIAAAWTASADAFVTGYQFEWKLSTDATYTSTVLSPALTRALISPAKEATYDVRLRAVNAYGAVSSYVSGSISATGKDTPPGDPSSLASETVTGGVKLTWTNPIDNDLDHIEVWEASSNDRALAAKVADVAANFFTRSGLAPGAIRYYWVRAVDTTGNLSGYNPAGATAGVSGTAGGAVVDYADVTGTKPPANADNTVGAVEAGATVTSGGITFSAGGAIKGGATEFLTGTGWFLGYSGGQYKFSIGDPNAAYMSWDGLNLSVKGNIINNTTYTAGGTLHSDLPQVSNIYVGQFDTVTLKSWTCTANGTITVNVDLAYASGFTAVGLDVSIKKNGAIQGGAYVLTQVHPTYYTLSRSFTAAIGDTITVVAATPDSPTYCNVKNLTVTIASVNVIAASQSLFTMASSTYTLAKKIQMPNGGVVQVTFDLRTVGGTAYGRIYKNGVAVGTERTTSSGTFVSWSENITFSANDTIELWIRNSTTNSTYNQRFELAVNQALTTPVALQ